MQLEQFTQNPRFLDNYDKKDYTREKFQLTKIHKLHSIDLTTWNKRVIFRD